MDEKDMPKWAMNKLKYDANYARKNIKSCTIRLNKITEPELCEIFDRIPNKADWFRRCLLAYAAEHPKITNNEETSELVSD